MKTRAVFFDRDDTLIRNKPYLGDPSGVELIPGTREALSRLRNAGFLLVLISNQSGVGRGMITEEQVRAVNLEMQRQLGMNLDGIFMCFDFPESPEISLRRKPSPEMLFEARDALGIDLSKSFMVGDKPIDIEAGHSAGCFTVLVLTGDSEVADAVPSHTVKDVSEAADWILSL